MSTDFIPFPKVPRLLRPVTVCEKIDGTNASIAIFDSEERHPEALAVQLLPEGGFRNLLAGSRNRWLSIGSDNFGFAAWVTENVEQLWDLGPGRHFGEWWGRGIQRTYGLSERRFSLFNVGRWCEGEPTLAHIQPQDPRALLAYRQPAPECCSVVPVLWAGPFCTHSIQCVLEELRDRGSSAAPGFPNPEGLVVYHHAANQTFKLTFDDNHKG